MEDLEAIFENSLSLTTLEVDKNFLENERQSRNNRLKFLVSQTQRKCPTLMDTQDSKRILIMMNYNC